MIECYYKECDNHLKDEPFCKDNKCTTTNEQIIVFQKLRDEYLTSVYKTKQEVIDKRNKRETNE